MLKNARDSARPQSPVKGRLRDRSIAGTADTPARLVRKPSVTPSTLSKSFPWRAREDSHNVESVARRLQPVVLDRQQSRNRQRARS